MFILYLDNHLQQYGLQYLIVKCIKWASQKKINPIKETQHFPEKNLNSQKLAKKFDNIWRKIIFFQIYM